MIDHLPGPLLAQSIQKPVDGHLPTSVDRLLRASQPPRILGRGEALDQCDERVRDVRLNAFSIPMLEAIHAALDEAQRDGAVVLLTGRERYFSAGFDLSVFAERT